MSGIGGLMEETSESFLWVFFFFGIWYHIIGYYKQFDK